LVSFAQARNDALQAELTAKEERIAALEAKLAIAAAELTTKKARIVVLEAKLAIVAAELAGSRDAVSLLKYWLDTEQEGEVDIVDMVTGEVYRGMLFEVV
jgi:septal ring factor EnvC (AmiA/AmiB activator)